MCFGKNFGNRVMIHSLSRPALLCICHVIKGHRKDFLFSYLLLVVQPDQAGNVYFHNAEHSKSSCLLFLPCIDSLGQSRICAERPLKGDNMFHQSLGALLLPALPGDRRLPALAESRHAGVSQTLGQMQPYGQNCHGSQHRTPIYRSLPLLRSLAPESAKLTVVYQRDRTENMTSALESTCLRYKNRSINAIIIMQLMGSSQCQHYIN